MSRQQMDGDGRSGGGMADLDATAEETPGLRSGKEGASLGPASRGGEEWGAKPACQVDAGSSIRQTPAPGNVVTVGTHAERQWKGWKVLIQRISDHSHHGLGSPEVRREV